MKRFFFLCLVAMLWGPAGTAFAADSALQIKALRVEPLKFNVVTGLKLEPILEGELGNNRLEYRWLINGEEALFETSEALSGNLLRRDDAVSVEVTLIDSSGNRLDFYESLPLKVVNASPVISSAAPGEFRKQGFHYQVEAADPDGDVLSYRLEDAPEGMLIDSATGRINWTFDSAPEGQYVVDIVVEDGFGGRAEQKLDLNLTLVAKE